MSINNQQSDNTLQETLAKQGIEEIERDSICITHISKAIQENLENHQKNDYLKRAEKQIKMLEKLTYKEINKREYNKIKDTKYIRENLEKSEKIINIAKIIYQAIKEILPKIPRINEENQGIYELVSKNNNKTDEDEAKKIKNDIKNIIECLCDYSKLSINEEFSENDIKRIIDDMNEAVRYLKNLTQ